jgi:hypothetical protein
MDVFDSFMQFLTSKSALSSFIFINTIIMLIIVILYFKNKAIASSISKNLGKLLREIENKNVQEMISECIEDNKSIKVIQKNIEEKIKKIEINYTQTIQKIGIIRFNAFENVGSDLSFSIALMDYQNNGVVVSGLYSRESSNTYAKPIINGNSKYTLSAEEIQAINLAKKNYEENCYKDK